MSNVIDIRPLVLENYWTWGNIKGEIYKVDYAFKEHAYLSALNYLQEECERDGIPGSYEADIYLLRYSYDPKTSCRLVWEVKEEIVECEYDRGGRVDRVV